MHATRQTISMGGGALMVTLRVVARVIGGAMGSLEYHWSMELCMRPIALGGCRFSGS